VETLLHTSQGEFPVVDSLSRPVGLLARNDLIRALKERGRDAKVGETMTVDMVTLGHRHCLDEAFRLLQQKSAPAIGIVDASRRLIGLVSSATIGEMLMVHRAMPGGLRFGPWGRPAGA
jgi:stage IV sporulation protein FB